MLVALRLSALANQYLARYHTCALSDSQARLMPSSSGSPADDAKEAFGRVVRSQALCGHLQNKRPGANYLLIVIAEWYIDFAGIASGAGITFTAIIAVAIGAASTIAVTASPVPVGVAFDDPVIPIHRCGVPRS